MGAGLDGSISIIRLALIFVNVRSGRKLLHDVGAEVALVDEAEMARFRKSECLE